MLENILSRAGGGWVGGGWVAGGWLDQLKIRLTQPWPSWAGARAELGNFQNGHYCLPPRYQVRGQVGWVAVHRALGTSMTSSQKAWWSIRWTLPGCSWQTRADLPVPLAEQGRFNESGSLSNMGTFLFLKNMDAVLMFLVQNRWDHSQPTTVWAGMEQSSVKQQVTRNYWNLFEPT